MASRMSLTRYVDETLALYRELLGPSMTRHSEGGAEGACRSAGGVMRGTVPLLGVASPISANSVHRRFRDLLPSRTGIMPMRRRKICRTAIRPWCPLPHGWKRRHGGLMYHKAGTRSRRSFGSGICTWRSASSVSNCPDSNLLATPAVDPGPQFARWWRARRITPLMMDSRTCSAEFRAAAGMDSETIQYLVPGFVGQYQQMGTTAGQGGGAVDGCRAGS